MKTKFARTLLGFALLCAMLGVFTQSCYADGDFPPPIGKPSRVSQPVK